MIEIKQAVTKKEMKDFVLFSFDLSKYLSKLFLISDVKNQVCEYL